jgi:hypothetical protein
MPENYNDLRSQQSGSKSPQQTAQNNSSSPRDKLSITIQDEEEWDIKITDQRRPQFRASENYRRRNF